MDKLRLWYGIYQGDDESVGPLVAGRLHGRAAKIATLLKVPRPAAVAGYDQGDAALVRLAVDEVHDPNTGQLIQEHIPKPPECFEVGIWATGARFGNAVA